MKLSRVKVYELLYQCPKGDQGPRGLFVRDASLLKWSLYFMDGM
jgi:hypothetical protein